MPYGYYYFDPTYVLVLIGALLSIWASSRVQSTFRKYARVRSMSGMTGAQVAELILKNKGYYDVRVARVKGDLTDHYDPRTKVVKLSDSVYDSTLLVPAANFGSKAGIPIILLGILFGYNYVLVQIGIWVFALAVLFQLVTLPVEFNASSRALVCLEQYGILASNEKEQSAKVLRAAALTYVAAAAASILQLLRLIMLFGGGRRRDD